MPTYTFWAEHESGESVAHPCRRGTYEDPVDSFEVAIEAGSEVAARKFAIARLEDRVRGWEKCDCERAEQPGSNAWWNSVSLVNACPADEPA